VRSKLINLTRATRAAALLGVITAPCLHGQESSYPVNFKIRGGLTAGDIQKYSNSTYRSPYPQCSIQPLQSSGVIVSSAMAIAGRSSLAVLAFSLRK